MAERTIAIGDIHGCSAALRALLDIIDPGQDDVIVTLGDYVDRGDDSRGVIDQLIRLGDKCQHVPLIGNHEVMMVAAIESDDLEQRDFWLHCGGQETLASYGGAIEGIPSEHIDFIKRCRRYYEISTHAFVHANYAADLPLRDQSDHDLLWRHLAELPPPHVSQKRFVVGHTPQADGEILDLGHVVCIDTFCYGSGWLTALDVSGNGSWQADRGGHLRFRPED